LSWKVHPLAVAAAAAGCVGRLRGRLLVLLLLVSKVLLVWTCCRQALLAAAAAAAAVAVAAAAAAEGIGLHLHHLHLLLLVAAICGP
jgi:hypothetical protein